MLEMLIVVAIIAILITIAVPTFTKQLEKSRETVDAANIRSQYAQVMMEATTSGEDVNVDGKKFGKIELKQKIDAWQNIDFSLALSHLGAVEGDKKEPQANGYAWVEYKNGLVTIHYGAGSSINKPSSFLSDLLFPSKRPDGSLSLSKAIISGKDSASYDMSGQYGIENFIKNTNIAKTSEMGIWLLSQPNLKDSNPAYLKCVTEIDTTEKSLKNGEVYTATVALYYGSDRKNECNLYIASSKTVYVKAGKNNSVKYYADKNCTVQLDLTKVSTWE